MDSYRGFEDETAVSPACDDEPAMERPPEIGVDERRMHVRAYNYWVSLLKGRAFPDIQDIDPHTIEDFGANSVLLDFSKNPHDPQIVFLGRALREECGLAMAIRRISEVPPRSLLSRLTDHYMQIIANRSPIGFEAEFVSQRGHNTLYRGILMPLSSNGEMIDFIYGVINWKELADDAAVDALAGEVDRAAAAAPAAECAVWADGPHADLGADDEGSLGLFAEEIAADDVAIELAEDASLADRLFVARDVAEQALAGEQRSRAALYRALGLAWDFALAAEADRQAYAELLDDAGIKAQARAPMTAVAKLVFGAGYDKTRLTEFAAALAWARRHGVAQGGLAGAIEAHDGGLKGVVADERRARRPAAKPDPSVEIRERLRSEPGFARVEVALPEGSDEFVLLLARRDGDGLALLASVDDARLVDRAIRKSA